MFKLTLIICMCGFTSVQTGITNDMDWINKHAMSSGFDMKLYVHKQKLNTRKDNKSTRSCIKFHKLRVVKLFKLKINNYCMMINNDISKFMN